MEKSEFRVLIKHYYLRKKTVTQIKEKLDKYYGDSAPSIAMVKKWFTDVMSKSLDSLFDGKFGVSEGARNERSSSFSFLSLSLSLGSRLERVPRVERICVRPQIAGQRPT